MSANRLLGRASFLKLVRYEMLSGVAARQLRNLSSSSTCRWIECSSRFTCTPLLLSSQCVQLNQRGSSFQNPSFVSLRRHNYSTQSTAPKPSVTSVGLADQALRSSIVKEDKEKEKAAGGADEEKKQDQEKQVRAVKFTLIAFGGIFIGTVLYVFFVYGAPVLDRNGKPMRDQFSDLPFLQQYMKRAQAELTGMVTMVTNPSRDKLLPDPVKPPYHQPPYTLLIELTGVLVHPDWTYKTGWRFKKRPGVDYFLNQLSGYFFEVVIYTTELGFTAFPIIDALDSQNVVHYRLFRDSTKYEQGVHVKDLDKINRDLSKVIVIEWNDKSIHEHRNNGLVLPRWKGNDDDRTLFDLASLLQTIGSSGIEDVRGVLEYYSKFDDPIAEFRKKQQELALKEKEMKAEKPTPPAFAPGAGWVGSLFRKN